ncbi:CHAT domain-containing protein [Mycena vulgaris]|nr:CHAT domain-containing protein [Mycena vulgaris]
MLNHLGNLLFTRFQQLGDIKDLDRAMKFRRTQFQRFQTGTLREIMVEQPQHITARARFNQLDDPKDLADLDRSILIQKKAVDMTPDGHHDKPTMLNNIGACLDIRFQRLDSLDDLDKSVSVREHAVSLIPDDEPTKPSMLNHLGSSLLTRFERLSKIDDIDKAVSLQEQALPSVFFSLGISLHTRFEVYGDLKDLEKNLVDEQQAPAALNNLGHRHGHLEDLNKSVLITEEAAALISDSNPAKASMFDNIGWFLLTSLRAIREGRNLALNGDPNKASMLNNLGNAFHTRFQRLGNFEDLEKHFGCFRMHDRYHHITRASAIVRDAAGAAIASDQPEKAVEWLEQGPEISHLAEELIRLSAQLEGAGTRGNDPLKHTQSLESLLRKIRKLKGFERFLLPKTISELARSGKIPRKLMHYAGRTDRLLVEREGDSVVPEDHFAHILSELWVRVVKLVLDALAIKTPTRDNLQRVWWCVTGPLTFPFTAGLYGGDDAFGSKLSDFVISSYTPSLTALIECFRSPTGTPKVSQLLAVAQPAAFGQAYLPGTREEIDHIQHHASGGLPVLRLEEDTATVDGVKAGMLNSNWVHFACHGVQVISDPTQSALLLAGKERLSLSSIIKLSLPHANFAFLSACQTATGDKKLQEESVHLAAGMLLAGYRGVIATMWTIMDNDAPQVAGDVYEHLFKTSPPDPTRAAEALHLAVRKLREQSGGKKSFFHWVPFIHVGV